ncbi:MAG: hypothetical protein HRU03_07770 [Nanoarchaeales archaeon]|nr:hypothetical protein [Nanoarchaeales archaeon]
MISFSSYIFMLFKDKTTTNSKINFKDNFKIQLTPLVLFSLITYIGILVSYLIISSVSSVLDLMNSLLVFFGILIFVMLVLVIWYITIEVKYLSNYNNMSKLKTFLILVGSYIFLQFILFLFGLMF